MGRKYQSIRQIQTALEAEPNCSFVAAEPRGYFLQVRDHHSPHLETAAAACAWMNERFRDRRPPEKVALRLTLDHVDDLLEVLTNNWLMSAENMGPDSECHQEAVELLNAVRKSVGLGKYETYGNYL